MWKKMTAAGALAVALAGGGTLAATNTFGSDAAASPVRTSSEVQPGGVRNDAHPDKVGEAPEREGELMNSLAANDSSAPGVVQTWGGNLNVRSGPGTENGVVDSLVNGSSVTIVCQTYGSWVEGYYGSSNLWNQIGDGRFVADAFTYTGSNGMVAPQCGDDTPPPPPPADGQTRAVGQTRQVNGFPDSTQCTWYAQERFHDHSGRYMNVNGNASAWNDEAATVGWTVSGTPAVHSVVVWEAGSGGMDPYYGHVAWVTNVEQRADGTYITVEERNNPTGTPYAVNTYKHGWGMSYILAPSS